MAAFHKVTLDALRVTGARRLRDDAYYPKLEQRLRDDRYAFRVKAVGAIPAGHALLLNLSFWSPSDGADVLVERSLPADVVAHVAWHHVVRQGLGPAGRSVDGMLLGESIASAFDLYLIGRLLRVDPSAELLRTQVPALSEVAADAGLSARGFATLLTELAGDPAQAFSELRRLLFEVATRLVRVAGIDQADAVLARFRGRRFFALLHHYNLSNWVLHSRAYGPRIPSSVDGRVTHADRALRGATSELCWLSEQWL